MKQDNDGIAWHYGVYAQDSFKVNAKLTLEYGLRWEYHPPFTDTGSDITNFDRAVPLTGRVIIPNKQQALQITAPGFLQSINACPGASFNGIPCTPFLTADKAGYPNTLRFSQKKDFNRRLGFEYRPFADTRTVVRGAVALVATELEIRRHLRCGIPARHGKMRDRPPDPGCRRGNERH